MDPRQTIEIRQVANGYIVMPATCYETQRAFPDADRYVFQTFAELVEFLQDHFSYRSKAVILDTF
jgi:hypothetical protein